jgi:hypothetical protein
MICERALLPLPRFTEFLEGLTCFSGIGGVQSLVDLDGGWRGCSTRWDSISERTGVVFINDSGVGAGIERVRGEFGGTGVDGGVGVAGVGSLVSVGYGSS